MVILHPDFLVSSTVVADSFACVRKAVFQDRVKATGDISKPMVYGNILHSLFQIALEANDFSTAFLRRSIDSLVIQYVESLYVLKEQLYVATEYLLSKIHFIQEWAKLFVRKTPKVVHLHISSFVLWLIHIGKCYGHRTPYSVQPDCCHHKAARR